MTFLPRPMPTHTKERLLHHVIISVFCKPYDDPERVLAGLDTLSPVPTKELLALDKEYDPERQRTIHHRGKDITLTVQEEESDDGDMIIYTLFFRKIHDVNGFARKMVECMSDNEWEAYTANPAALLDSDGKLSVRFDKRLLLRGKLVLTDRGDCYAVKAAVAAYPKKQENVERVVRRILTD